MKKPNAINQIPSPSNALRNTFTIHYPRRIYGRFLTDIAASMRLTRQFLFPRFAISNAKLRLKRPIYGRQDTTSTIKFKQ